MPTEYNDGSECRVYDKYDVLIRIIPHNPRPARMITRITERDLDIVLGNFQKRRVKKRGRKHRKTT